MVQPCPETYFMSKALLYDSTVCIGCKQCEQACATQNKLPYDDAHRERRNPVRPQADRRAHARRQVHAPPVHELRRSPRVPRSARSVLSRRLRSAPSPTTLPSAWDAATAWSPAPSASRSMSGASSCPRCRSAPCVPTAWPRESQPRARRSVRRAPPSSASAMN